MKSYAFLTIVNIAANTAKTFGHFKRCFTFVTIPFFIILSIGKEESM